MEDSSSENVQGEIPTILVAITSKEQFLSLKLMSSPLPRPHPTKFCSLVLKDEEDEEKQSEELLSTLATRRKRTKKEVSCDESGRIYLVTNRD